MECEVEYMKNKCIKIITTIASLFCPTQLQAYPYKGNPYDHDSDPVGAFTMMCAGLVGLLIKLIIKKDFYDKHPLFVHILSFSLFAGIFFILTKESNFSLREKISIGVVTIIFPGIIHQLYEK